MTFTTRAGIWADWRFPSWTSAPRFTRAPEALRLPRAWATSRKPPSGAATSASPPTTGGTNNYFGQIHILDAGDRITLTTKLGTKTYEVTTVSKVSETDRTGLEETGESCLTLYTCVRDQRDLRYCVRAVEVM